MLKDELIKQLRLALSWEVAKTEVNPAMNELLNQLKEKKPDWLMSFGKYKHPELFHECN